MCRIRESYFTESTYSSPFPNGRHQLCVSCLWAGIINLTNSSEKALSQVWPVCKHKCLFQFTTNVINTCTAPTARFENKDRSSYFEFHTCTEVVNIAVNDAIWCLPQRCDILPSKQNVMAAMHKSQWHFQWGNLLSASLQNTCLCAIKPSPSAAKGKNNK